MKETTIRFTPRQWEFVSHRLTSGVIPEVFADTDHLDYPEDEVRESVDRLLASGDQSRKIKVTDELDIEVLVECLQDSVWIDYQSFDDRDRGPLQRVKDNATERVEDALGIIVGDYDWHRGSR